MSEATMDLNSLGNLVGLPSESQPSPDPTAAAPSVESGALLDEQDLSPVIAKTTHQSWSHPGSKFLLVGGGIGIGALVLNVFLHSFDNIGKNSTPAPPPTPAPIATPQAVDAGQQNVATLKTVAALSTQAREIQHAGAAQGSPPARPTTAPAVPTVSQMPRTRPSPPEPPATFPVQRSLSGSFSNPAPIPQPRAALAPPLAAQSPVDPAQAWNDTKALGSYGSVQTEVPQMLASETSPLVTAVSAPDASVPQSIPAVDRSAASSDSSAPTPASALQTSPLTTAVAQAMTEDYNQSAYQADEQAILSGTSRQSFSVPAGAIASGRLVTPVVWAKDMDANQQAHRYSMELTQPLMSADGSIALPAGSQILLQVSGVSETGMMELQAVEAMVMRNGVQQTVPIPPGALSIGGEDGNPLIAEQKSGASREIARIRRDRVLMGALGQVGQLLTQPRQTSTFSSPFTGSTSTTNPGTSATTIAGALLQGAFGSMNDQESQQRVQELSQRPNLWLIPADHAVQIFVNSSFELTS